MLFGGGASSDWNSVVYKNEEIKLNPRVCTSTNSCFALDYGCDMAGTLSHLHFPTVTDCDLELEPSKSFLSYTIFVTAIGMNPRHHATCLSVCHLSTYLSSISLHISTCMPIFKSEI